MQNFLAELFNNYSLFYYKKIILKNIDLYCSSLTDNFNLEIFSSTSKIALQEIEIRK